MGTKNKFGSGCTGGKTQDDDETRSEVTDDEWDGEGGRRSRRGSASSDSSLSTLVMDAALESEIDDLAAQVRARGEKGCETTGGGGGGDENGVFLFFAFERFFSFRKEMRRPFHKRTLYSR